MNPFRQIWFNTGATIDYFLITKNRHQYIYELVWIGAISFSVVTLIDWHKGLGIALFMLLSIFWVLMLRFLIPAVLKVTGGLMNGHATMEELQIVVSLSCIPCVIDIFYVLLAIAIPGNQPSHNIAISTIAGVCSLRILVTGLAKTQKIPDTFALMNAFIPYGIMTLLFILLAR